VSEEEEHKIWRGELFPMPALNPLCVPLRPPRDAPFFLLPAFGKINT
jgi:hypothetical protein